MKCNIKTVGQVNIKAYLHRERSISAKVGEKVPV